MIRIYAMFGVLFLFLMGIAWMIGSSTIERNVISGAISLIVGIGGVYYLIIDFRKYKKRIKNENKKAVKDESK